MRLLIATQALDQNHPNLGFFVRWVAEFAKHCESVVVVASSVGEYQLPHNVKVHSLGKEVGLERRSRIGRFVSLMVALREDYDAVFVHMIPEFALAGALPWKLMGKRVGLWYVHGSVPLPLRLATPLVDFIATASPESFRIRSPKVHVVGHGIDTEFFSPDPSVMRGDHLLSVGRLMPSKHHDRAIAKAKEEGRPLRIIGEGPDRAALEAQAHGLGVNATFVGGVAHDALRDEYRRAAYLFHASDTGSLDKVVLEAFATDTPVVTTSEVYRDFPREVGARARYIKDHHSLTALVPKILALYAPRT